MPGVSFYTMLLLIGSVTAAAVFVLLAESSWRAKLLVVALLAASFLAPRIDPGLGFARPVLQVLVAVGVILYFKATSAAG
jgi:hypothetical protein